MTDINHAKKLQHILNEYYNHYITRDEYLRQRKEIFDAIDHANNGIDASDSIEPGDNNFLDTTSFYQNSWKNE